MEIPISDRSEDVSNEFLIYTDSIKFEFTEDENSSLLEAHV